MRNAARFALECCLVACLIQCSDQKDPGQPADSEAGGAAGVPAAGAPGSASMSGAGATVPVSPGNRLPPTGLITGACDVLRLAGDPEMCAGIEEFLSCSATQCQRDACATTCGSFIECALAHSEHCSGVTMCPRSIECADCMVQLQVCSLVTSCGGRIKCATPAQGGTCQRLEACCMTQRQPEGCVGWAEGQGLLSGDAGCAALLADAKFVEAYASDPPCTL